jgi:5'-nucleotidase / UDP-sugar diphosphatase
MNPITRRIFLKQGLIATSTLILPLKLFADKPGKTIDITILHTNDIHGYITASEAQWADPAFPPKLGGGSALATLLKQVKNECMDKGRNLLLLDAGDIYQGTPIGDNTKGKAIVDFFNMIGYDCWTLGNHDFDDGDDNMLSLVANAKMPVLSANTLSIKDNKNPGNIKPYIIKDIGGLKIGIIGITTEDMVTLVPHERVPSLRFASAAPTVRKYVLELKKSGVDFIILLSHLGFPRVADSLPRRQKRFLRYRTDADKRKFPNYTAYLNYIKKRKGFGLDDLEVSTLVKNIDLIVGGHSHIGIYPPFEIPETHTFIFQAYARLSTVGRIDLSLSPKDGALVSIQAEAINLWKDHFKDDYAAHSYLLVQEDKIEGSLKKVIGRTEKELTYGNNETTMGNLVTDAMKESVDADLALVNRGGIRSNLRVGEIQEIDIYRVIPFDNPINMLTVDGATLLKILEIAFSGRRKDSQLSGVNVLVNPTLPSMNRVCEAMINGKPLNLKGKYKFATSAYLAEGAVGYGILKTIQPDMIKEAITVRKALIQYVIKHSPLKQEIEGRIKFNVNAKKADYLK